MSMNKTLMKASASLTAVLFLACFWSSASAQNVSLPLPVQPGLTSIPPSSFATVVTQTGSTSVSFLHPMLLISAQLGIQAGDTSGKIKVLSTELYIGNLQPSPGLGGWKLPLYAQSPLPTFLSQSGGQLISFGQMFPDSLLISKNDLTPAGTLTVIGVTNVENTDATTAHSVGIAGSVLFYKE